MFYGSISFGQLSNSGYIVFCLLLIWGGLRPPYRYGAKYTVARKLAKRNGAIKGPKIGMYPPDSAISLRSLRASDGIAQKPAEGGPGSARLDPDPQKRTVVLSCPIQSKLFSHNCLPGCRTQKGLIGSDHDDSPVAQGEDIAASLERLSLSDSRPCKI